MARPQVTCPPRSRCLAATLAAGLGLAGCVDFVDLTVAGGQEPARLQVTLRLLEDQSLCRGGCSLPSGAPVTPGPGGTMAWFDGRLQVGADAGGTPRMVIDETLEILGQRFQPVVRQLDGTRLYEGVLLLPTADIERVRITLDPPDLEAVGAEIPTLSWFVPGPAASDTVRLTGGEDLLLALAPPAEEPDPSFQFGSWAVEVPGERPLRISATGAPPLDFRLPPYYLTAPPGEPFQVRFEGFLGGSFFPPPNDYLVSFVIDLRLGWIVVVEDDAAELRPAEGGRWGAAGER